MDREEFLAASLLGALPIGNIRQELLPKQQFQSDSNDKFAVYEFDDQILGISASGTTRGICSFTLPASRSLKRLTVQTYRINDGTQAYIALTRTRMFMTCNAINLTDSASGPIFNTAFPAVGALNRPDQIAIFLDTSNSFAQREYARGEVILPAGRPVSLFVTYYDGLNVGERQFCYMEMAHYL